MSPGEYRHCLFAHLTNRTCEGNSLRRAIVNHGNELHRQTAAELRRATLAKVTALLRQQASIDAHDRDGFSALHIATTPYKFDIHQNQTASFDSRKIDHDIITALILLKADPYLDDGIHQSPIVTAQARLKEAQDALAVEESPESKEHCQQMITCHQGILKTIANALEKRKLHSLLDQRIPTAIILIIIDYAPDSPLQN